MKGTRQCHVALVSKWCDDESWSVAQVFIAISEPSVGLLGETVLVCARNTFISGAIVFLDSFPVVSELTSPIESIDVFDSVLDQVVFDNDLGMDIKHD